MEVTLLGMVKEVNPLQPPKADPTMEVTLLGIMVFFVPMIKEFVAVSIMALQLPRESYFVLPASTLNEVRPLHQPKAPLLMDVTLLGIVTEVKPLHFSKAE